MCIVQFNEVSYNMVLKYIKQWHTEHRICGTIVSVCAVFSACELACTSCNGMTEGVCIQDVYSLNFPVVIDGSLLLVRVQPAVLGGHLGYRGAHLGCCLVAGGRSETHNFWKNGEVRLFRGGVCNGYI